MNKRQHLLRLVDRSEHGHSWQVCSPQGAANLQLTCATCRLWVQQTYSQAGAFYRPRPHPKPCFGGQEALPVDSSPTSSNVEEVTLTGEELRSSLPHTVAFQGVHRGPDFQDTSSPISSQTSRDLSSGEKLTPPLELRRLTGGKRREVYEFQPTRQYLLKLSVHGRELEATWSLPTMTPETLAFQPYFTKLFWARESTEYLVLTEILQQQKVVALNILGFVPRDVVIQAGVTLAYAKPGK